MNADILTQPAGLPDFIAAAALALLILLFLIGRHRYRRKEAQMRERLDSLKRAGTAKKDND